jgi:hypothetical protein
MENLEKELLRDASFKLGSEYEFVKLSFPHCLQQNTLPHAEQGNALMFLLITYVQLGQIRMPAFKLGTSCEHLYLRCQKHCALLL